MRTLLSSLALGAFLFAAADARAATDCVTHRHLDEIRTRIRVIAPGPARFGEKLVRDAHGTFPNQRTSANFVAKWGPDATYTDAQVDRMLVGFEDGWAKQVAEMGHPAPAGSDTYRVNVYIGNSGGNAPTIPEYAGGYATIDAEGYPMMVMSPGVMDYFLDPEYARYGDGTSVHELFHIVQFATGAFQTDRGYWFWEATAEWAAGQTYPGHPSGVSLIGGFALYPHVALDFYDYPDEGTLVELHHYGAFVFPQFVTEHAADWSVVRDAWTTSSSGDDPIAVMTALLDARGVDIAETYAAFAAHNATWDYASGDVYAQMVDYYADSYPNEDFRFADEVPAGGTGGLVEPPAETLPGGFGYNVLRLAAPSKGPLTARVEGEQQGSSGSEASFGAHLVRQSGAGVEYVPLTGDGRSLSAELDATGEEDAIYLVVASAPASWHVGETFGYAYALEYEDAGGGGCGCTLGSRPAATGTRLASLLGTAAALALVLGRRRSSR